MKPRVRRLQHGVRSWHRSLVCRGWWSCLLNIQVNLTCCSWTSGRFLCRLRSTVFYLDQWHFGSINKKPTILVGTLPVARLSGRLLKNTDCINVLRGTEALPPGGYPAELCKQLAHKILLRSACSKFGVHTSRPGIAHLPCERVSSDNPCKVLLTPRVSEAQDLECLGGLRSCRRVRLRMPVSCARGLLIRRALEDVLTKIPGLESR